MNAAELKNEVRSVFDPLSVKLGLVGHSEASLATTEFSLGYVGHPLGIQVLVEMSQLFIHVLLFRSMDGEIPFGFTDAAGDPQKIYLQQGLKALSINSEQENQELRKLKITRSHIGNLSMYLSMSKILAELLERHWLSLSNDAEKLFR
jgi:hypothetical protein